MGTIMALPMRGTVEKMDQMLLDALYATGRDSTKNAIPASTAYRILLPMLFSSIVCSGFCGGCGMRAGGVCCGYMGGSLRVSMFHYLMLTFLFTT
jgi:hypothetical protein